MRQPLSYFTTNAWRWSCGLPEVEPAERMPDLETIRKTQRSERFAKLCENRMVLGAFRYGLIHGKNRKQYDRISSMIKRLEQYRCSGNLEHLVDVANLAMLEFEEGCHPNRHFKSIDDGYHTSEINERK